MSVLRVRAAALCLSAIPCGLPVSLGAQEMDAGSIPVLEATETGRWQAPEAGQGVAVDADHFYAITNSRIGKYDKRTGARVGEWTGDRNLTRHINSCAVQGTDLVCANSNFPLVPMASSIEIFDTKTLIPKATHSLGHVYGSLTWVERHEGRWWAGFAHYDEKGGEPSLDHRYTQIVILDDDWRRVGGYLLPDSVLDRFAPMSNSGGSFGPDGYLYLTGHDRPELYVLAIPRMGVVMQHVATIAAPLEGQAWARDRSEERVVYGITREAGEVVSFQLPPILDKLPE